MIYTYTDLTTSIANWIARSDLSAVIPEFIQLAEDRINNDVNARDMETITTVTATAGNAYINLPAGVLEIERIVVNDTPLRVLTPISADQMATAYVNGTSAKPANYSVIGGQVQLAPIPDSDYTIEIVYTSAVPSLLTNSTNWLLTRNPSVYLWASLIEAAAYIQDPDKMNIAQQKYQEAVARLNKTDWSTYATPRVRSK